jgi:GTP-binding protein Era
VEPHDTPDEATQDADRDDTPAGVPAADSAPSSNDAAWLDPEPTSEPHPEPDREPASEPEAAPGWAGTADTPPGFRSGFVSLVGRPNVGKSTLLNQILGQKVAIVSDKPQTTRHRIQGVLTRPDSQVVFVDTPGIHKPRTPLGERLNAMAESTIPDVDVVVFVIDATQPLGRGDRWVAERVPHDAVVVVTKVDRAGPDQVLGQLAAAAELDLSEYFPVSGRTGEGVPALVEHLVGRLPEGPRYYPEGMVTDVPDPMWVAELVRERLLALTRDELPHSITTRVTEWEWPVIRCEILVERESQKGIVIGRRGAVLKQVGTEVRKELPEGAFLELHVRVEKDWQRRPGMLDRLGF